MISSGFGNNSIPVGREDTNQGNHAGKRPATAGHRNRPCDFHTIHWPYCANSLTESSVRVASYNRTYFPKFRILLASIILAFMISGAHAYDKILITEFPPGSGHYRFYIDSDASGTKGVNEDKFIPIGNNYYRSSDETFVPHEPLYNGYDILPFDETIWSTTINWFGVDDPHKNHNYDGEKYTEELEAMAAAGYNTVRIFVSHYFHTDILANLQG